MSELWSTPNARDDHNPSKPTDGRSLRKLREGWTIDLNEQAAWFDVAHSENSIGGGQVERMTPGGGLRKIEDQVEQWQTPATDSFRSRGGVRKDEMGLDQQARILFVTPSARDWKGETGGAATMKHLAEHGPTLSAQIEHEFSLQDPQTATDGLNCSEPTPTSRRRLNPAFVCQLMAWPWWWTQPVPISFAREEMELFLSRAREHLSDSDEGLE